MTNLDIISIVLGFSVLANIVAVYCALHYRKAFNQECELRFLSNDRYCSVLGKLWKLESDYKSLKSRAYIRQGRAFRRYLTAKEY